MSIKATSNALFYCQIGQILAVCVNETCLPNILRNTVPGSDVGSDKKVLIDGIGIVAYGLDESTKFVSIVKRSIRLRTSLVR